MGYRSDIRIKLVKKHAADLLSLLQTHDLLEFASIALDKNYVYCAINDLKWYDAYFGVRAISDFVKSLSAEGGIIAIGEDGAINHYGRPDMVDLHTYTKVAGMCDNYLNTDKLLAEQRELYPEAFI